MRFVLSTLIIPLACGQVPAEFRTPNFIVHADCPELAKLMGESAEACRQELAEQWLGKKQCAAWSLPCDLYVSLTMARISGFTEVSFADGKVSSQKVKIQGPLDRVIKGALPHELVHVLFAHHFGA